MGNSHIRRHCRTWVNYELHVNQCYCSAVKQASHKQEACEAHAVIPSLVKALVRLNLSAMSSFGHYTSGLSPNLSYLSQGELENALRSRKHDL